MCTKIQFKTKQENIIVGRTGEFDAYCETNVVFLPKGTKYRRFVNNDSLGTLITNKFMIGTTTPFLSGETLLDGMNEDGLVFNTHYYSLLGEVREFDEKLITKKHMDFTVLATTILSNFSTCKDAAKFIEENEQYIGGVRGGTNLPYHYSFTDKKGDTFVLETVNKKIRVKWNNEWKVMTNTPSLEQHISNAKKFFLENKTNVDPLIGEGEVPVTSNISTKNLPGGFDAQSRFIRASWMIKNMEPVNNGDEAINTAFRILHSFDVVAGTALTNGNNSDGTIQKIEHAIWSEKKLGHYAYATDCIIISDTQELKYYWKSINNISPRFMDMKKLIKEGSKKVTIKKYNDGSIPFQEVN